jgi:hypothetical protein
VSFYLSKFCSNKGSTIIVQIRLLERKLTVSREVPAFSAVATFASATVQSEKNFDFVAAIALLARLEKQETDLLIQVQIPHAKGDIKESDVKLDAPSAMMKSGLEMAAEMAKTLEVKNWRIFGQ